MTTRLVVATPAADRPPRRPDIVSALREMDRHLGHAAPSRALETRVLGAPVAERPRGTRRGLWLVPAIVAALLAILFLRRAPEDRRASTPAPTGAPTASPEASQVGEGDLPLEERRAPREAPSPWRAEDRDADLEPSPRDVIERETPQPRSSTSPLPPRAVAPRGAPDVDGEFETPRDAPPRTTPRSRPTRRTPFAQRGAPIDLPLYREPARANHRGGHPSAPAEPTSRNVPEETPADPPSETLPEESLGDDMTVTGCDGLEGPGRYEGYFCESESSFIATEDISCEEALDNCERNATSNPTLAIACTWSGALIFVQKTDAEDCAALLGELDLETPAP